MKKSIELSGSIIFFIFMFHSHIFSQSFYHINKKAVGYSYSTANTGEIEENIHEFYISSGKADLFFLHSDSKYSDEPEESFRAGLTAYAIDEFRLWYPSFSLFVQREDGKTGVGTGTSLPLKVYSNDHFDLIPEVSASVYFMNFKDDFLKTGKTCIKAGMNMGYYISQYAIISVEPAYKFINKKSFLDISAGLIYVIGYW